MKFILEEHSSKYVATVLQISGIACWSILGSKVFTSTSNGDLSILLEPNIASFALSVLAFILGLILIGSGWYIMTRLDRYKIKQRTRKNR